MDGLRVACGAVVQWCFMSTLLPPKHGGGLRAAHLDSNNGICSRSRSNRRRRHKVFRFELDVSLFRMNTFSHSF